MSDKPDYIVPINAAENRNLVPGAVFAYTFLINTFNQGSYAECSDRELSDLMRVSVRTVQRYFIQLEKEGFIRRVTTQEGMIKERKIYFCDELLMKYLGGLL